MPLKKTLIKLTFSLLFIFLLSPTTKAETNQEYLLSWIPATCCVTNQCCWKIEPSEIKELEGRQAEIRSTGQIKRYDFSPDNNHYRCACDYDPDTKNWIKHQGANTRCLFVPRRMF